MRKKQEEENNRKKEEAGRKKKRDGKEGKNKNNMFIKLYFWMRDHVNGPRTELSAASRISTSLCYPFSVSSVSLW